MKNYSKNEDETSINYLNYEKNYFCHRIYHVCNYCCCL